LPNFGNTGYVFPSFVQFKRGDKIFDPVPNNVELNVPYFSQRDNPRFDWSTCNVTSIAMVLYYYGLRSQWGGQLEDELLQWCFDYAGQGSQTDHSVLSALIQAYGFKTSFSTTRRWAEVRSELLNRRPVVLAGDFTAAGHILTVIGYNSQGYIVQDPWGDALTGYSDTEGRKLMYPYSYVNQVAGPDGNVWAHFIYP
ncbi:MAG TPA: C39 family peptidase, partial [Microcoleus sp.]|nr:C39 family peptidase [Microcoleus sp.]